MWGRGKTSIMAVLYKLVARMVHDTVPGSCRSGRWTRLRARCSSGRRARLQVVPSSLFQATKAPLIPHLLSVREGEDAGGVNRPARLPPCDGVLWPTGPDTSRRLHYAYRPEVGRRWERTSPARPRRVGPAKDVRVRANTRCGTCSRAID